jgi:hypothetical protein
MYRGHVLPAYAMVPGTCPYHHRNISAVTARNGACSIVTTTLLSRLWTV